jgi:FtsH Extracellular
MLYVGIAVFVILLLQNWSTRRGVEVIPYSEFEQLLRNDEIKEVYIPNNAKVTLVDFWGWPATAD